MTFKAEDRVVITENGYDEDQKHPFFKGESGVVTQVVGLETTEPVYYIAFDNPRVNKATDEDPDTTWPFYLHELEAANA